MTGRFFFILLRVYDRVTGFSKETNVALIGQKYGLVKNIVNFKMSCTNHFETPSSVKGIII